jgi:transcription elongation GreA/GreB family factor
MSVAFRRDGDEEHLEPKFELPIPAGPNLVTARGLELIEATIHTLQRGLAIATEDTAIAAIKRDLRYWQARQITAQVPPEADGSKVEFGVTVRLVLNGKPKCFRLVGDDEADPASGTISFKSPLSQAILGAEVGDVLPFGGREDAIQVVAIEAPPAGRLADR